MCSSIGKIRDSTDNTYFNAIFTGTQNGPNNAGPFQIPAEFAITRTTPIVPCASDYYCSIVRFAIPLDSIPLLVMPIIPGCDTWAPTPAVPRNITPFRIGIRYNGVTYIQNIVANDFTGVGGPNLSGYIYFQPENYAIQPVFQTSLISDKVDPYYQGIFNYESFFNMFNGALANAFGVFAAANPGAPQAIAGVSPFFYYDSTTQLISLVAHNSWATNDTQMFPDFPNTARVCMNLELGEYLQGFWALEAIDNTPMPTNQLNLIVQNLGYNGYPINTYPAVPTYLFSRQDYNIITNWNSLRKIVITTNTLPIQTEAIPTGDLTTGQSSNKPIISDFIPQLTTAGDSRSIAYYNPSAQYRLVDMNQDIPLQKVDLKVFWEDKDNNLYPLFINKYNQASVKVAFLKKSLYKKHYPGKGY